VIFSSHLLDEVERMCDHVTVLHEGRVAVQGPVDEVRAMHRVSQVRFPQRLEATPDIEGALSIAGDGRSWSVVHTSALESLQEVVARAGGAITESRIATLEEILIARVRHSGRRRQAA
jgi:ABC-2 type transport system ATP-binding protein